MDPERVALIEQRIAELKAGVAEGGAREAAIRALVYIGMAGPGADERAFNTLRQIRAENEGLTLEAFKQILRAQYFSLVLDQDGGARGDPEDAVRPTAPSARACSRASGARSARPVRSPASGPNGWRRSSGCSPPRASSRKAAASSPRKAAPAPRNGTRRTAATRGALSEGGPCHPPIPHPVLQGAKALVVGVANDSSIAYGCAKAFRELGADLAITYLNEKARPHVEPLARELQAPLFLPLDVSVEGQLEAVFEAIASTGAGSTSWCTRSPSRPRKTCRAAC